MHDQTLDRLFDLHGRVAFVPGGYGGIGEAIAWGLALAGAGWRWPGAAPTRRRRWRSACATQGMSAHGLAMDAHAVADIRAAVDAVAERFGALDLLVNCIGMQREQRLDAVTERPSTRWCRST